MRRLLTEPHSCPSRIRQNISHFLGYPVPSTDLRHQGVNSMDILVGLNPSLNPSINCRPIRRLPKCVLNHCLNLRLNSSLKFQVSIESPPRSLREISPLLTSGWGMGTERYLLWVLQQDDIRDLQVFPRLKGMRGGI